MKKIMSILALASAMAFGVNAQEIGIFPSPGGPQSAASFGAYASNAVQQIRTTGTLPVGQITSPSDARMVNYLRPEWLMTSSSPFYNGVFNPVAPWQNERGTTIWWWVSITAKTNETISLDQVTFIGTSSDPQGSLNQSVGFGNRSYTQFAIGIDADGGLVTSGASSKPVKRLIFAAGSRSFGVVSADDVTGVRAYMEGVGEFTTTATVSISGASASRTLSVVPPTIAAPRLFIHKMGSVVHLGAETNGNTGTFVVQGAPTITGPWSATGMSLVAGQQLPVTMSAAGDSFMFFRLQP